MRHLPGRRAARNRPSSTSIRSAALLNVHCDIDLRMRRPDACAMPICLYTQPTPAARGGNERSSHLSERRVRVRSPESDRRPARYTGDSRATSGGRTCATPLLSFPCPSPSPPSSRLRPAPSRPPPGSDAESPSAATLFPSAGAGVGAGGLMGAFPLFGGLSREAAVLLVEAGKLNVSARFADLGGRGG